MFYTPRFDVGTYTELKKLFSNFLKFTLPTGNSFGVNSTFWPFYHKAANYRLNRVHLKCIFVHALCLVLSAI